MAKPLRSQLNQIRAWVRQGRTDAWIAHQLEVSASELREFRRRHELDAEEETGEVDLRDEIEAEIEAATREEEELAANADAESDEDEAADEAEAEAADEDRSRSRTRGSDDSGDDDGDGGGDGDGPPKRRRRRRRGGRSKRSGAGMQATFDHGKEGYGLWLDPTIADDPVYTEHWADHRQVEVTVEPDRIVIKRAGGDADPDSGSD
jgi:membrane protein involved in colicin uptake